MKGSTMWKRSIHLIALVAAVLLVTAACAKTPGINSSDTLPQGTSTTEPAPTVETLGEHGRIINIELTEFAIAAASLELTPGETVEFLITNSGVVEHEFRLSNMDRVDEHMAGGHEDHDDTAMTDEEMAAMMDDEAAHDDDEAAHDDDEAAHDDDEAAHDDGDDDSRAGADDVVLVLAAGESGTLVFTVPGNDHDYTVATCLIPGHFEAGMTTELGYRA
jgi:uncharacterized cupredoxin-like copper-binding protein